MAASSSSNNDKSTIIQAYKDWFNDTFVYSYNSGSSDRPIASIKAPEIGITIHSNVGTVVLPILPVLQNHTIRQIFLEAIKLLENSENVQYISEDVDALPTNETPTQEPLPPGYDFDDIEYRKKIYIVHSYLKDGEYKFKVERQEDRKIIDEDKATWKRVVDAYKQKYPDKF